MLSDKPRTIFLLAIVYITAIATSLGIALYFIKNIEGNLGIRLGLAALVIGTVHLFMLIGMIKEKQWGYELIQVMSKFFLIASGLGAAPLFLAPKSSWPLIFVIMLAYYGYKKANSNEFKEYFGRDPEPEQLTHL